MYIVAYKLIFVVFLHRGLVLISKAVGNVPPRGGSILERNDEVIAWDDGDAMIIETAPELAGETMSPPRR